MSKAAPNTCPVCKRQQVVEAPPVTRTTRTGRKLVVALRLRCVACGYTDRTTMFRGATSLNTYDWPDGSGRGPFPEEIEN